MKRRRAEESADGLALMTSSVTSSYSADGLRESSRKISAAIAKRCRLHKLIRQRFALALKIQQEDFALITSRKIQSRATVDPVARFIQSTRYDGSSHELQFYASSRKDPYARKADVAKHCNHAQSIQSTKILAEDEFSRRDKSAAKQLTIYESWMSTAELNSNGENDKKPAKEKDASTIPCRYFTRHISNGKKLCPTERNLNRGLYTSRAPLKKIDEKTTLVQLQYCGRNTLITQCTNRGKNEKKDEAIDRH
ncbi:something about silencing protein 10 [Dorcoceras hygrometricum]|uniref:Something about silencing protein 10 n=1 Tax=Dorcoceras hygrometricum TaxID=472368 RepID=A0A2Z7A6W3_9LAMI|nr:something about silencing protein 10 [Dorcoceras hygrometricum]